MLTQLRELLGDDAVVVDPEVLAARGQDRSGTPALGRPLALVRPGSTEQVSQVLRTAHAHGVPVVPQGALSGLAGGANALPGSILLDLTGMNQILRIDPVDLTAVVQPGVITADLAAAAAARGLFYAPDPASAAESTIGGNVATNAGGMRCVKYGVTRDAVRSLEAVLANGDVVRTAPPTVKGVAGLDLTSLLVGSEGTLGVIVGATVRLTPRSERQATIAAAFPTVTAAATACAELTRHRLRPSMVELLDPATLAVIDRQQGTDLAARGGALVLAQVDGPGLQEQLTAVQRAFAPLAGTMHASEDPDEAASLLAARRLALPSIEAEGRALIEDICVPRSRLAEAVEGVAAIAARHGVATYTFAHAGDGNLHPILSYGRDLDRPPAEVTAAADAIFALALELGGTVTGEHGIGLLKRAWLAREVGTDTLGVFRSLKRALDPYDILNPGKAL